MPNFTQILRQFLVSTLTFLHLASQPEFLFHGLSELTSILSYFIIVGEISRREHSRLDERVQFFLSVQLNFVVVEHLVPEHLDILAHLNLYKSNSNGEAINKNFRYKKKKLQIKKKTLYYYLF